MEDGVYRLMKRAPFGGACVFGAIENQTLHTCWHVGKGCKIRIGDRFLSPSYEDVSKDIICWGGPCRIMNPRVGEKVHCRTFTPEGHHIDYTSTYVEERTVGMIERMKSKPGCSGSPIYVLRGRQDPEGDVESSIMVLAGLLGTCVYQYQAGLPSLGALDSLGLHVDTTPQIIRTSGSRLEALPITENFT